MEPLVENHTELTQELFLECVRSTVKKGYVAFVAVCGALCLALSILLFCFQQALMGDRDLFFPIFFLIVGCFFFVWLFVFPIVIGKRQFRQLQIMQNEPLPTKDVLFFPDHLEVVSGNGGRTPLPYRTLKHERVTKRLYVLIFEGNVAAVMRQDAFTKGSFEDARALVHGH